MAIKRIEESRLKLLVSAFPICQHEDAEELLIHLKRSEWAFSHSAPPRMLRHGYTKVILWDGRMLRAIFRAQSAANFIEEKALSYVTSAISTMPNCLSRPWRHWYLYVLNYLFQWDFPFMNIETRHQEDNIMKEILSLRRKIFLMKCWDKYKFQFLRKCNWLP